MKLFTAKWCVNCGPIKKMIEDNKYAVEVIDVDKSPDLVRASGVRSIPCLLTPSGDIVVGSEQITKTIREAYGSATHSN